MYEIMLPAQEAFGLLGHGNIGLIRFCSIFRAETPNCRRESEVFFEGETKWERNVLHTPRGDLTELRVFEPAFDSSTARKHFVETREDYERLWSYLEDAVILDNFDQYYRDCAELGDDGIPKTEIERTPWQQLWIEWVGLEPLSYHLADWPDYVEHTLELLESRGGRPSRSPPVRPRRSSSWWITSRRPRSGLRDFADTALACMMSWTPCCRIAASPCSRIWTGC